MAKGAGKIGLGAGLIALGQQLSYNQQHQQRLAEIDAESQRRESLERMKRQFQIEDRQEQRSYDEAQQRVKWDREDTVAQTEHGRLLARDKYQNDLYIERDNAKPPSDKGAIGLVNPNNYTPESVNAFQSRFNETGEKDYSLLNIRPGLDRETKQDDQLMREARKAAIRDVNAILKEGPYWQEDNPGLAEAAGITQKDSPIQVREKLLDQFTNLYLGGAKKEPQGGQAQGGEWDIAVGRAVQAITSDADPAAVIGRMKEAGAPTSVIRYLQDVERRHRMQRNR